MKVELTTLDGVLKITPPTIFEDFRGVYIESYNESLYKAHGINHEFIQDDFSISRRGVLRGIHGDNKTHKLVSCIFGSFYLLVVNNDPSSVQFKKWEAFTLSDKNNHQILVPPNYGNGHLVISESAIFHYKQTTEYNRAGQFTINWDNPDYNFIWPIKEPILSTRDSNRNI
jgi:dTDP-4-dehydrorhamnose 3,5-epimerase